MSATHPLELTVHCPVTRTLTVIGRRWAGHVIWQLMPGRKRHGELLASIPGISSRMLTERLRELEQAGFVSRHVYAEVPLRVEYELTDRGRTLSNVFDAMCEWGDQDIERTP